MNKNINILKRNCLKITPGRISVLSLFQKNSKPLSAEEILKQLKGIKINLVTIYRTLESFEKKKIIKRVDLRKDSVFYELVEDGCHHHHIICKQCGYVEDFDVSDEKKLFSNALKKSKKFSKIIDHSLELFGVCILCLKKQPFSTYSH